jgi:hypothetical protein
MEVAGNSKKPTTISFHILSYSSFTFLYQYITSAFEITLLNGLINTEIKKQSLE